MDAHSIQGSGYYIGLAQQGRSRRTDVAGENRPVEPAQDSKKSRESGGDTRQVRETEEQRALRELQRRDQEVRTHEQAHARVGGQYAGAPSYQFVRGPDGQLYAVGGSVSIDTSPVEGDPEATLAKMDQVRRAALAPAEPSAQDLAIASRASTLAQQARSELMMEGSDEAGSAASPGERLMETLDRFGVMREPAEQGQFLDTRA